MDYKELGFKCGLEIHQQLDSKIKLFGTAENIVHDKNPNTTINRKLRAVVGETGVIDVAAAAESAKAKTFIYEGCPRSAGLIEFDEQPPTPMNEEALEIAIQIAKMLNMKIVDEVQVMRKTVVDGSNVSGFQRTALLGVEGYIETSRGRVGVPSIYIEEEAARKTKTTDETVSYRLDRLGVPLVEITTEPTLEDPEHCKEAAGIIGMILRSTGKVKRGIGTIRQDVNISIKGGTRTEVKGFQDLKSIPKVIDYEIKRQQTLIKKKEKIKSEVRKAEPDFKTSFLRPMPGGARLYPETDVLPVRITEEKLKKIKIPKLLSEQITDFEKNYKLTKEQAEQVVKNNIDLESYTQEFAKIEPAFIVKTLIEVPKELKSRLKLDPEKLSEEDYKETLTLLNKNQITREAVIEILTLKIKGEKIDLAKFKPVDDKLIEKEIKQIIDENKGAPMGALMGKAMAKLRGKVEGKKVSELLQKLAK